MEKETKKQKQQKKNGNREIKQAVKLIGSKLAFSSRGAWFKSNWGRKIFILHFRVAISCFPFAFKLIHDYAK